MEQSKAGKKLNPIIAKHTAVIYARDPVRYQRLCLWVWRQQKNGWPDEAIAKALELGGLHVDHARDWWNLLTSLLPKAKGRAAEDEAQAFKTEVSQLADEFVEFVKAKKLSR